MQQLQGRSKQEEKREKVQCPRDDTTVPPEQVSSETVSTLGQETVVPASPRETVSCQSSRHSERAAGEQTSSATRCRAKADSPIRAQTPRVPKEGATLREELGETTRREQCKAHPVCTTRRKKGGEGTPKRSTEDE